MYTPPRAPTWQLHAHAFAIENFFLVITWLAFFAHPVGQLADFALLTIMLLGDISANGYICSLPYVNQGSLTSLTLGVRRAAGFVSSLLTTPVFGITGIPPFHQADPAGDMSCPAVLGVWQMVGWLLACHVVLLAEIMRRRAFLRRVASQSIMASAEAGEALGWPDYDRVRSMLAMSFAIFSFAGILWMAMYSALT